MYAVFLLARLLGTDGSGILTNVCLFGGLFYSLIGWVVEP